MAFWQRANGDIEFVPAARDRALDDTAPARVRRLRSVRRDGLSSSMCRSKGRRMMLGTEVEPCPRRIVLPSHEQIVSEEGQDK
jgi:hypothetical protein